MSRSLILAIGGAAALALTAAPALADGYARGQVGAPQARAHHSGGHSGGQARHHGGGQTRVHHSGGPSRGHNWNAASSRNVSRSVSVDVSGGSHRSSYVGRPQVETVIHRSGGGYGGHGSSYGYGAYGYGYGGYVPDYGPGYAGYGATYSGGVTSWGRPAGQSSYWDYRYRTGNSGAVQGFGRQAAYYGRPAPHGYRDDRDGHAYGYGHDRGGRYGFSDGDRYASTESYSWSSDGGYGDYGYTGSDYGRDWSDRDGGYRYEERWDDRDHDRGHDRDWGDRYERHDRDGRRWECNCRETY